MKRAIRRLCWGEFLAPVCLEVDSVGQEQPSELVQATRAYEFAYSAGRLARDPAIDRTPGLFARIGEIYLVQEVSPCFGKLWSEAQASVCPECVRGRELLHFAIGFDWFARNDVRE